MNLTNFGNLSYTARRAVGYDQKCSFSVFWKISAKEARRICTGMGIQFHLSVNKETLIPNCHKPKFVELESRGILVIRVR